MKISYIITPFGSSEYLVRCINSILRQTGEDNEIIIAENGFELSDDVDNYIFSECHVKRISDVPETYFEKITEAVKLARNGALIKLIDVETVAVPIASAEAADCETDIVFVPLAVKNQNDYTIVNVDEIKQTRELLIKSIFINKKILKSITYDVFSDPFMFELWLDKITSTGAVCGSVDVVCFYVKNEHSEKAPGTAQQYIDQKDDLLIIFENSLKSSDTKAGLMLFDKYMSVLCRLMNSGSCDEQTKAGIFGIVKETARRIGDNDLAQHMFLLYFGVSTETVVGMDADAYMFYSGRVLTLSDKGIVTAKFEQIVENSTESLRKSLSVITEIKSKQDEAAKKTKEMSEEIRKLKNDIAALTKNMHFVFNSASVSSETEAYTEPIQQIPAMFAQGKLGLKVIFKSFKAWLKYKFSRKK